MTAELTTVLAVDDQPANVRLLEAVLTPRGYRVVGAESGDEALNVLAELAVRARPVALLVSDQRMPGLTGIELGLP